MVLVDTNILLDVATNDHHWYDWSIRQLDRLAVEARLVINPVVYSELSIGYERVEEVETAINEAGVELEDIPRRALFLAGKAYRTYRTRGGTITGVLPDFFIGAHAAVQGIDVLTRDPKRYRSYFPEVRLITPGDA